jgi:hypothetical protein
MAGCSRNSKARPDAGVPGPHFWPPENYPPDSHDFSSEPNGANEPGPVARWTYRAARRRGPSRRRFPSPIASFQVKKGSDDLASPTIGGGTASSGHDPRRLHRTAKSLPKRHSVYSALGAKMISERVMVRWPRITRTSADTGGVLDRFQNVRLLKRRLRTSRRNAQRHQPSSDTGWVPERPPITAKTILKGCA